ncbi:MAG: PAS domain-containing sensor histidine kinase [Acidaminococcaceae bacterium]|nr:PAS domain-containing sensor histidine kinase [Acidaminococcaceae bacterium]
MHPDDAERAAALMQSISETGEYNVSEFRFVCRSGEVKLVTVTFCYVSAEDSWDGIPSIYSVGLDVTEERQEQERQHKALEDAYQSLHIANLAKSNFLSSMSHDIHTPMNAIIGMTAIAKANLFEPEKVSGCLNKINVSSRHLLRLINEVLDMSKIESGKVDLMLEDVSLPDVVDDIVSMCRPLMQDKQQAFKVNIFNVRNEHVITDGDRLRQVFTNLLSNAIKYTPEGGKISLTINELNSEIDSQGRYEFIFADDGIGIPEEYMQHIFEPFARANDESISKIQGTGLGLAITQNIVQMMNGTIEVQSRPSEGSTFTVTVPLALQMREE